MDQTFDSLVQGPRNRTHVEQRPQDELQLALQLRIKTVHILEMAEHGPQSDIRAFGHFLARRHQIALFDQLEQGLDDF